jgi:hypothetical protein
MARTASTAYTAAGTNFEYASADGDPILPEDIWLLAKALEQHTHESTRGAAVRRIETASAPSAAGHVQISSDTFRWWGTGSSAIFSAASLTGTETFTNKTLVTPIIASFANANHNHSNSAGGGSIDGSAVATTVTGTGNVVKATSPSLTTPTIAGATLSGAIAGGTFTGSTMTSPALNSPTITTATFSGTQSGGTFTGATLTTPTIASFTNAQHDHSNAAGGGLVSVSAPSGTIFTDPKINDTTATHTYNFAVNELAANRTITLPLLTGNDTFVFADFSQTLTNKTLTTPTIGNFTNAQHGHTGATSGGTLDASAITGSITGTGSIVKGTSPSLTTPSISGATVTGTVSGGNYTGATLVTPVIASFVSATHDHTSNAGGGALDAGAITTGGTGTGSLVRASSPTLTTPSISSFANANHNHSNSAGGGNALSSPAITTPTITTPTITSGITLSSGQISLPVGSAGSPSLVFDSGNGIYSAGTDRLNFATAGVVRAEIDAAGNIGVGITPSVWEAAYAAVQVGTAVVYGNKTTNSAGIRANSYFDGSVNRSFIAAAGVDVSLSSGAFSVYTAPSVSAGATQTMSNRLTIENDGRMAFNTSISTSILQNLGGGLVVSGAGAAAYGTQVAPTLSKTGTGGNIIGLNIGPSFSNGGGISIDNLFSLFVGGITGANSGTVINAGGLYVANPAVTGNAPTNQWAIYHGNTGANLSTAGAWNPASHEFLPNGERWKQATGAGLEAFPDPVATLQSVPVHRYDVVHADVAEQDKYGYLGYFAEELNAVDPLLSRDGETADPTPLVALQHLAILALAARVAALENA